MKKKKKSEVTPEMQEVHCVHDGRFLGYHYIVLGEAWFFCPRCKHFTIVAVKEENTEGVDT